MEDKKKLELSDQQLDQAAGGQWIHDFLSVQPSLETKGADRDSASQNSFRPGMLRVDEKLEEK